MTTDHNSGTVAPKKEGWLFQVRLLKKPFLRCQIEVYIIPFGGKYPYIFTFAEEFFHKSTPHN